MTLTDRATKFLNKQEFRSDAVKSLEVIIGAFIKIGVQPTQELIDFQLNFGGLTIYAGLEPICFGILHEEIARGNFGKYRKEVSKLIYHPPEYDLLIGHLACADTLYQECFTIDFEGNYYEGWELKASKFEVIVEDLAIFGEIDRLGYKNSYHEYFENLSIDFEQIKRDLNFANYPEFPQDIIKWGKNAELIIRMSNDKISLYSKSEIGEDQKEYLKKITNKEEKTITSNTSTTTVVEPQTPKSASLWLKLKSWWS